MLSRRVITRSGRHFRGRYPSRKMGRMIQFESLIERDVIQLFEFSPGVVSFREQPVKILYGDEDRVREYYPDFEVLLKSDATIHVEVKPSTKLSNPSISQKLASIASHYELHRQERFLVVTEFESRKEPLFSNLRLLGPIRAKLKCLSGEPSQLPSNGIAWGELEEKKGRDFLVKQLALGFLHCDLAQPLEGSLLVYSSREVGCDSIYF